METTIKCERCEGSGRWGWTITNGSWKRLPCPTCDGTGRITQKEGGYLTTELLAVAGLSLIPVSIILVWVAKMAAMVTAV